MEKTQAKNLIKQVFEHEFNLNKYNGFLSELLGSIEIAEFNYHSQYVKDKFKAYIKNYRRIGKYKLADNKYIELLVVNLTSNCNLDRNRSSLRNFILDYLDGGRGEKTRDYALVAFVEVDTKRWRLSLISLDKVLDSNKKVKTQGTSAKRYSYVLGEHEPSHTAQTQLLPLLENNTELSDFNSLEKAFAVEKLSNEFFTHYVELLAKTKNAIIEEANHGNYYQILNDDNSIYLINQDNNIKIDIGNFAKKLLGQIVFLYFLQKKGWLGVAKDGIWGQGDKAFMRNVFKRNITNFRCI